MNSPNISVAEKDTPGRRQEPLYGPFPAKVRGVDADGEVFKVGGEVEVISIREVRLRLGRRVAAGAPLLIVTRFSKSSSDDARAPTIALRGTVSDMAPGAGKEGCVVVTVKRTRFL